MTTPGFTHPDLLALLKVMDEGQLDALPFGLIGLDAQDRVCRYNLAETRGTGLQRAEVQGQLLFTEVAQCMNNYQVAQRFHDASSAGTALDVQLPYTLTWRMRPTAVTLRLLAAPGQPIRYVAVHRPG